VDDQTDPSGEEGEYPLSVRTRGEGRVVGPHLFDGGKPTREANSVNDGPQRKATEENESLKCAQGILHGPHSTGRIWRADAGNMKMAEAIAGRTSRGVLYVYQIMTRKWKSSSGVRRKIGRRKEGCVSRCTRINLVTPGTTRRQEN